MDWLDGQRLEEALAALLFDGQARAAFREGRADARLASLDPSELEEAAASVRRMVLERTHRGTGGLTAWFPQTLAAWRTIHPDDQQIDALLEEFCASTACAAWRELPGEARGISLEEAFYRFFVDSDVGNSLVREQEFLSAIVRGLAIAPHARFAWPSALRAAPGGCFALTATSTLHAALDGRYVSGSVDALVAALLNGEPSSMEADAVRERLREMRLLE